MLNAVKIAQRKNAHFRASSRLLFLAILVSIFRFSIMYLRFRCVVRRCCHRIRFSFVTITEDKEFRPFFAKQPELEPCRRL